MGEGTIVARKGRRPCEPRRNTRRGGQLRVLLPRNRCAPKLHQSLPLACSISLHHSCSARSSHGRLHADTPMELETTQLACSDPLRMLSSPVDIYTRVCTSFPSSGGRCGEGGGGGVEGATGAPLRNSSGGATLRRSLHRAPPASLGRTVQ